MTSDALERLPAARAFALAVRGDWDGAHALLPSVEPEDWGLALVAWIDTMNEYTGANSLARDTPFTTVVVALQSGRLIPIRDQRKTIRTARRLIESRARRDHDGFLTIIDGVIGEDVDVDDEQTGRDFTDLVMTLLHITATTTRIEVERRRASE